MEHKGQDSPAETVSFRSTLAAEAAEAMARADRNDGETRAAYARLLVEQSKSFGTYVRQKIGTRARRAR